MTELKYLEEPNTDEEIYKILHPVVARWFKKKFGSFSDAQKYSVAQIWKRQDILLTSPTGSGKTLCAFASILSYLITLSEKGELEDKVYAVYSSPLKALSKDIEVNLNEPLKEMEEMEGKKFGIRVGLRTGDTTVAERAKMLRKSPHILISTPESLAIILTTTKFIEKMWGVEFCVVDEIHSLDNKRGTYLSLTLERLNEVSKIWPTKIGLSATVEPLDEVAQYLVGEADDRTVAIARVPLDKKIDVQVLTPVKDLIYGEDIGVNTYSLIDKLIKEHKTTLIFTNTRSATERVVSHLKDKYPTEYGDDNIAAHHSSLSKAHRFRIEENLRAGKLKVVVCSTSLELGIDIGFIDLVIMLGSPKSSSRALQRLGRAGHQLHNTAKGRFIVNDRDDLVECSVIQKEMIERKINKIRFPINCLDVLAQQIYGMAIYKIWDIDELFNLIKKSYCYRNLRKADFLDVIAYLSGDYELEKSFVYGKIWYDPVTKQIGKKGKLARVLYLTNIGTIPEESFITVKIAPSGESVGAIDESFMERMKKGDVFVLGGSKYVYRFTRGMNLYVNSAENRTPTIPSWFSEQLPLAFDSALEIMRFRTLMKDKLKAGMKVEEVLEFIKEYLYVSESTAKSIYEYFNEQYKFFEIPDSKTILVEEYRGEKNYLLFHSMYGRRVNDVLSRAIAFLVGKAGERDIEVGINDNGFYLAGEKMNLEKALKNLEPDDLEKILKEAIEKTDVLARRFRHCASRALMILRNYKGQTKSVGKQQMKSHYLYHAVKKITGEFPILREARREVLDDLMDLPNAKNVLTWIKEGKIKWKIASRPIPSPFASNLILQGQSDLIRIEDKQQFLKRLHELHMKSIGAED
ncbi:MAG: ATP-dependent helicase [Nanoarchaeota archaeon]